VSGRLMRGAPYSHRQAAFGRNEFASSRIPRVGTRPRMRLSEDSLAFLHFFRDAPLNRRFPGEQADLG